MTTTLRDAIARLHSTLDALAQALTSGDANAVLAAEVPLGSAVTAVASMARRTQTDTDGLPDAIAGVRTAMDRCTTLGRTAEEFSRAFFPDAVYGRPGLHLVRAAAPLSGRAGTSRGVR